MKPVLIDLGAIELQSYGVSKALATLIAGWLLQRELARRGKPTHAAFPIAIAAVVGGFLGAKLYYLLEASGGGLTAHDFGGNGFTWYGGMIGGAVAVAIVARRRGIALGALAGMAAIPLAVAYGIGRLGCLLAGDGTYGTPTDLPWGMAFPNGTVPTTEQVHPAPLYEALAVFAIAGLLWALRDRLSHLALFGVFSVLFGAERLIVEFVRLNDEVVVGLTAPQLWSLALIALGAALLVRDRSRLGRAGPRPIAGGATP
jgi:phosphatidylglycerol---prolipoprotein diacylglyceryl transferase